MSLPYIQCLSDPYYQETVKRIARKYTQNTPIAWQDAAQTAHVKVIQAVQAGKFHRQGNFYHWAFTVATLEIIDLIRKEMRNASVSLDQPIPGTTLPLLETIPDEVNLPDAIERADLVLRVRDTIADLDRRYPERGYLQLWQGLVANQKQTAIAAQMGISQGEVAKRRKELAKRIVEALGLSEPAAKPQQTPPSALVRRRSNQHW